MFSNIFIAQTLVYVGPNLNLYGVANQETNSSKHLCFEKVLKWKIPPIFNRLMGTSRGTYNTSPGKRGYGLALISVTGLVIFSKHVNK